MERDDSNDTGPHFGDEAESIPADDPPLTDAQ